MHVCVYLSLYIYIYNYKHAYVNTHSRSLRHQRHLPGGQAEAQEPLAQAVVRRVYSVCVCVYIYIYVYICVCV